VSVRVEDIYELAPLQEGLLFHSLYSPESGAYVVQYRCLLEGELDLIAFESAWRTVVERHAALRTAFQWQGLEKPLQVVYSEVPVVIEQHDWRHLSAAEQANAFADNWAARRQRGFDLVQPPLMAWALMRVGERSWRFVWSLHHLLVDGWSLSLVLGELFKLYEALRSGRPPERAVVTPYARYLAWLQDQDSAAAEAFWRRQLAGYRAPLPIAGRETADRLPSTTADYQVEVGGLPAPHNAALSAFAQRHRLTVSTVVQGAFALLLSHYSGVRDLLFGSVVSGRPPELPGVESMVGMFVNTVPVRIAVDPRLPAVEWLQAAQAGQAASRHFEYCSLVDLHGWSEVPRSLPLFEALFCFENFPVDEAVRRPDLSLRIADIETSERVTAVVGLLAAPQGDGLLLEVHHDAQRFGVAAARRLLGHLRTVLATLTGDRGGQRRLGELEILTAEERRQILGPWRLEQMPYAAGKTIYQLIVERAAAAPDDPAVGFGDQLSSYAELVASASRVAVRLRGLGVGPEQVVGLLLERSPAAVVGLLGILEAGGAYLPLDPALPPERLAFMLRDAGARVVLTGNPPATELPAGVEVETLELDPSGRPPDGPGREAGRQALSDNLAYVIYTSGSTGRPKGVALSHRGLCNFVAAQGPVFDLRPGRRILQFSSLSFDASVFEILVGLAAGAELCLGERQQLLPGPALVDLLASRRVNVAVMPPSVLAATPYRELPDLDTLIVAGEACPPEVAELWGSGRRFLDAYGPSEATVCSTVGEVGDRPRPDIGRPIGNVEVVLVDRYLRAVPEEVTGEILIGGPSLARGYLGLPALTAASYVPDPFADQPGQRLYRSGDLGRYLPDGHIDFLGRKDQQVKVRGFRIEPGEVENALGRHRQVRQVAVLAERAADGDYRLFAYLVAVPGASLTLAELRSFLSSQLPDYMLPSRFVELPALPLSHTGKIDRAALLLEQGKALDVGASFVAPRNQLEHRLAEIWAEVLAVESVGIDDNVFDLGAHSLSLVKAHGLIGERLEIELPLVSLFNHPSVKSLAAKLSDQGAGDQPLADSEQRAELRQARRGRRSDRRQRRGAEVKKADG